MGSMKKPAPNINKAAANQLNDPLIDDQTNKNP
jgi:hypothetical protein